MPLIVHAGRQRNSGEAGVEEELLVAFHASDGGGDGFDDLPVEGADAVGDAVDGELVGLGVADDAAFADVAAAGFELGLDEDDGFDERRGGGEDGFEKEGGGDERHVHNQEQGLAGVEGARGEEAGVGALHEGYAGVSAELHRDLAEAGVDGGDVGCAVLEEAVCEAAGGGANVKAGAAGNGDLPMFEGFFELEAAATDVALLLAEEAYGGVGRNGGAGLVHLLLADENAAGEDEGAGALAAGDQAEGDKEEVNAGFGCLLHLFYGLAWLTGSAGIVAPAAIALWWHLAMLPILPSYHSCNPVSSLPRT